MEMARGEVVSVRRAQKSDIIGLSKLMEMAEYRQYHSDWFSPADWLGSPLFVVAEEASSGRTKLVGCLTITAEVLPAAWVRLVALRDRNKSEELLNGLFNSLIPQLYTVGVEEIGWLVSDGMPENLIKQAGFSISNWIITLQSLVGSQDSTAQQGVEIREVRKTDLSALSDIERSAFEPIWQLNVSTLERAYKEAEMFKVAHVGDRVVGFQFCTATSDRNLIHLARITVDPVHQGSGIGTHLMADLVASCVQRGIKQISLNTQINNLASQRLYDKYGFARTGFEVPLYTRQIR